MAFFFSFSFSPLPDMCSYVIPSILIPYSICCGFIFPSHVLFLFFFWACVRVRVRVVSGFVVVDSF